MILFYQNLWQKKMSRVEVLRQCRLSCCVTVPIQMDRFEESSGSKLKVALKCRLPPRFWAAFVLCGDWR